MGNKVEQVVLIAEVPVVENQAPRRIQILPAGRVKTTKGELLVDESALHNVRTAMAQRGTDVLIDYEHHSVGGPHASPDGLAVAGGWIKGFGFSANDGLYADVEWTPKGAERVVAKEYRYVSPVADFDVNTRRVLRIKSVALVNTPATIGAKPIVLTDNDASDEADVPPVGASIAQEIKAMKDKLIGMLALKSDASEEDILSTIRTTRETASKLDELQAKVEVSTAICKAAGIDESDPNKVEAAVMVLAQKAKDHDTLKAEVDRLHAEIAGRDADTLIASAKAAGKLPEAQEPWARSLILKDKASFEEWLASAPVVRPQGKTTPPADKGGDKADRATIIATARKEWSDDADLQAICSERAFVVDTLRDKNLPALAEGEIKELALKA